MLRIKELGSLAENRISQMIILGLQIMIRSKLGILGRKLLLLESVVLRELQRAP